jgi:hypothetical protein
MPLIFIIVGLALLILDRTIKKNTVLIMKERLTYFIYYYRPHFQRRQFLVLILLVIVGSTVLDYLIFPKIDLLSHILLLPLMLILIYVMLFTLAMFDYWVLKKGAIAFNFFIFEREFIQIFSLAIFFPMIFFAYLVNTLLMMFLYPAQGMFLFHSLAGLTGSICFIVGLIGYLI